MRQLVVLAFALCLVLLCSGPSFAYAADAAVPTEAEFKKMKVGQLKTFLSDRGVSCESCAEKTDFVRECVKNANTPLLPSKVKSVPKGVLWEAWANVAHDVCLSTAAAKNVDDAQKETICNNIKVATESVFMQYGKRTAGKLRKKPEALLKTSFGEIYQDAGKKMLGKLAAYCFHAKNKGTCASSSKVQDLLENDDKVKGVKIVTYLTNVGIENTNPMYETLKNKALDKDEL